MRYSLDTTQDGWFVIQRSDLDHLAACYICVVGVREERGYK